MKQYTKEEIRFFIGYFKVIGQQEESNKFKALLNKQYPNKINDTKESFISQHIQTGIVDR